MNFVFDLDGTICFGDNKIDNDIVDSIKYLESLGHNVIFASARSYRDCVPVIKEFSKNMVIGLNGGVCYKNNNLIFKKEIPKYVTNKILNIISKFDLPYFLDDEMNYCSYKEEEISFFKFVDPLKLARKLSVNNLNNVIKMVVFLKNREDLVDYIMNELHKIKDIDVFYHENESNIYINPNGTNKATTIREVVSEEYICFGNDKNDIDMFKDAIFSVQVGDYEPLKNFSNKIVKENEVAKTIKNIINIVYINK